MDKPSLVLRILCLLSAAGLIIWSLSEDLLIGGGPGLGIAQLLVLACGLVLAAAVVTPSKVTSGIFSVFLSSAITLLLAEFILRAVLSPRYVTAFEADSRYHYKLRPGASREYQHAAINGGEKIIYHVNHDGFRGRELSRDSDGMRIVVYGDSFIQAEFSSLENTFSHQLSVLLREELGQPVEVINAGVAGYGPDQVYKKLADELPRLQPDLVIVAVFAGNDFGDLIRNKMYRLDENGALRVNSYTVDEDILRRLALARHEAILKRLLTKAKAALTSGGGDLALPPLEQRVGAYAQQHIDEYRQYVVEGDNVVRELLSDPYSADISLLPDSESARYKIDLMAGVVAEIKTAVGEHNTPLISLIIPHPMDLLDGEHDSGKVDRSAYPNYASARLTDSLQEIMSSQQVAHINLYNTFKEQTPENLYFRGGDDHWNDAGQRLAAETVSHYIVASHVVSGGDPSDMK